jgi:hypothetical protein
MNMNQEQAFLRMCAFLEDNDEEQLTLKDLANKMTECLAESDNATYSNKWLRHKLEEKYGDSLFISESEGLSNIVTFREKKQRKYWGTISVFRKRMKKHRRKPS